MKIVILAGGAGTRLWPMSTETLPKQFQKLVSDKTMLQETLERVSFLDPKDIYISTNAEYVQTVSEQAPNIPTENIIAEPSMQDTGPSIGLAAAIISKEDPEAIMAVVYADHFVKDRNEFEKKLKIAAEIAKNENTLNIIEVKAKFPNVNLGYVKIGRLIKEVDEVEVYEFKEFKEKPDFETAKKFLSSYSYLWNTGYYVWKASTILEEYKTHLPKTYEHLMAIKNGEEILEHYPACDKISIDFGIMEKLDPKKVRIIPADLGWSDIGTWKSLHEELTGEETENLEKGNVLVIDSEGSVIYNEGEKSSCSIRAKNMVVVNVKGYTLICPMDRSQDLKKLVTQINGKKT